MEALEAGHEGVVVKDAASLYAAGRRGKAWRKVKPETTTEGQHNHLWILKEEGAALAVKAAINDFGTGGLRADRTLLLRRRSSSRKWLRGLCAARGRERHYHKGGKKEARDHPLIIRR